MHLQDRTPIPADYDPFLQTLKTRIQTAQVRAALSVNRELILLYWQIGRDILARQQTQGWGAKIIDRLSQDLRAAFPEMQGFSARNLVYMQAFARRIPTSNLRSRLLHKSHGSTTARFSIKLKTPRSENGTSVRRRKTAGRATS